MMSEAVLKWSSRELAAQQHIVWEDCDYIPVYSCTCKFDVKDRSSEPYCKLEDIKPCTILCKVIG